MSLELDVCVSCITRVSVSVIVCLICLVSCAVFSLFPFISLSLFLVVSLSAMGARLFLSVTPTSFFSFSFSLYRKKTETLNSGPSPTPSSFVPPPATLIKQSHGPAIRVGGWGRVGGHVYREEGVEVDVEEGGRERWSREERRPGRVE